MNRILPSWEESILWTLLLERESFLTLTISAAMFCFLLVLRFVFGWYSFSRLGIPRERLRDRIARMSQVMAGNPQ